MTQAAGIQASPPPGYMSPTHPSPAGWHTSSAGGVTVLGTTAVDVKSPVSENR